MSTPKSTILELHVHSIDFPRMRSVGQSTDENVHSVDLPAMPAVEQTTSEDDPRDHKSDPPGRTIAILRIHVPFDSPTIKVDFTGTRITNAETGETVDPFRVTFKATHLFD